MPLIRIESRPKPRPERGKDTSPSRGRPPAEGGSPLPALLIGGTLGLVLVGAIGFALLRRSQSSQGAAATGLATPPAVAAGSSTAAAGAGSATGGPAVATVAGDRYAPADIIAWVSGQPYTYADLVKVVHIARVLGHFTGDAVPADTSPEMPGFQVQMLRRQIDLLLLRQEMDRQKVAPPAGDNALLVDAFLADAKATREQLNTELAANSVTEADLEQWFADSRAVSYFIQSNLAPGKEGTDRDTTVKQWLDAQWDAQEITISFYDPDEVLPATATAATPAAAATAP